MKSKIKIASALLACLIGMSLAGCGESVVGESEESIQDIKVESIDFNLEYDNFYIGQKTYIQDIKISPSNASNKKLVWSIENNEIAKIEDDIIVGLKEGTTKISAKSSDGTNVKKEVEFTVKPLLKPSGWDIEESYIFYYESQITLDITFYPNYVYVDKRCSYEVVDGSDVFEIQDNKIAAKKSGQGKIKVKSLANQDLEAVVNVVADDDLLFVNQPSNISVGCSVTSHAFFEDRGSVLEFSAPYTLKSWPAACVNLGKTYNARYSVIYIDAKVIYGQEWYSLTFFNNGSKVKEIGAGDAGGNPTKNHWTTNIFDLTNDNFDFDSIYITLCADPQYYDSHGQPKDEKVDLVFDNLKFMELSEYPSAITVDSTDTVIGLDKYADINVTFTPIHVINDGIAYSILEGDDVVEVNQGKLHGLKTGHAKVRVSSIAVESLYQDINVTVSDDPFVMMELIEHRSPRAKAKFYKEVDGRECVLSVYNEATDIEAWSSICFKLPDTFDASKVTVEVDSKLISGINWCSFALASGEEFYTTRIEEIGASPVKDDWTHHTFTFKNSGEAKYLYITINSVKSATTDQVVEVLFNNILIYERD